jgi:colanic acid biosynthesis glycosyl transferase WcaI
MRILLVNQFFYPDVAATSQIGTDLAKELCKRGHEVVVLTGRYLYTKEDAPLLSKKDQHGSIRIIRVSGTHFSKKTVVGRLINFASFLFMALTKSFTIMCDIVVCMTNPPFIGLIGVVAKWVRRKKTVAWLMDIYPDMPIAEGYFYKKSLIARLMYFLERRILKSSDYVITLTKQMADLIISKIPDNPEKVCIAPIWAVGEIQPVPKDENLFFDKYPLYKDKTVVMYSGNFGLGHDFDTILKGNDTVKNELTHFLFIGGGKKRKQVEDWVKFNSTRASILPYQPIEELEFSLSAGDIHLVTMKKEYKGVMIPGKIFGILAIGKPVLYIGPEDSAIADIVNEAECGFVVPNGDVERYSDCLNELTLNFALRRKMGQNSLNYSKKQFDPQILKNRTVEIIEKLTP